MKFRVSGHFLRLYGRDEIVEADTTAEAMDRYMEMVAATSDDAHLGLFTDNGWLDHSRARDVIDEVIPLEEA